MAEEMIEINENDEVVSVGEETSSYEESTPYEYKTNEEPTSVEEPVNPVISYLQGVFTREKSNEFLDSLEEEQKKFIYTFILGFQTAIGRNIVGVYDYDYISGFNFTNEFLASVNVVSRPIEVTDINLKFVLIAQY